MRVVLVDADPRHPELHRRFGVHLEPGLTTLLAGRSELADALAATSNPALRVLPAGPATPHLPAALQSEPLTRLLAELRGHADLVLVEAPPDLHPELLQAAARGVDGVVAVLDLNRTTSAALRELRDRLRAAEAPVLGLVLVDRSAAAPAAPVDRFHGLRVPDDLRYPPRSGSGAPARVEQASTESAPVSATHAERAQELP
jgi:non-specific protein-tyrosine kinase